MLDRLYIKAIIVIMIIVYKIFFVVCAIWFIMLLMRPKTKLEWKYSEEIRKNLNKSVGEKLGILGNTIFFVIYIPLALLLGFIIWSVIGLFI